MLISHRLARFARELTLDRVPAAVRRRAKLLILDALGIALASSRFDFAAKAYAGLSRFGSGPIPVIGMGHAMALRDAAMMNGILVHGLDYDDTYLPGSVHMTASNVPCALALGAEAHMSGADFLAACIVGLESGARIGRAGQGNFHKAGFHPTALCGAFSCALLAGRLMALDEQAIVRAQGVALSMASGSMQTLQDGTWTKRMHPGWAAAAGITAAGLASGGFTAPEASYEGRWGVYTLFLGALADQATPELAIEQLGEDWQFVRSSIKLYPACHQSHAFMNAAIRLARAHAFAPEEVVGVHALVADITRDLVCEPLVVRQRPDSSYLAQFSLPYAMAACLTHRRFGLEQIRPEAYEDPAVLALAERFSYAIDPAAGFPKTRTGEVIVTLRDGRVLRERDEIDPDAPVGEAAIVEKFRANAGMTLEAARVDRLCQRILEVDREPDMAALAAELGAAP